MWIHASVQTGAREGWFRGVCPPGSSSALGAFAQWLSPYDSGQVPCADAGMYLEVECCAHMPLAGPRCSWRESGRALSACQVPRCDLGLWDGVHAL